MIFYPHHHHHPISQNLLNGIQRIKIAKSYIFNLCLKIRLINGKFSFGKELRVLLWLLNEGQDLITYHSKWELPLIDWDCPIHGGRREERSGMVTQCTSGLLWEQEQLWLGAQAGQASLAKKPCSGKMSEHVSINQWTDLRNPSMSLSFQAGRVCASLSMLSWSWTAWGQPAGETGHGSNKSTDRQTPGLPVRWWNSSLALNGIEKLEGYWISLCGALTIQPVSEFI